MKRLLTVIGARPQIIKAAALSRTIDSQYQALLSETIIHTGQHYDANMSQVFFDELEIPKPHYNLGVGSGTHGQQTSMILEGIENIITSNRFDGMILYGDTNSTLAGALAASKQHLPIFHIEAGLRSFNMGMPEEINRIVCDQLSSILFAPTQTAINNLISEGFNSNHPSFPNGKERILCQCGDVMYDNAMYYSSVAEHKSQILERLHLKPREFVLATIHRPVNTDNPENLCSIFRAILSISEGEKISFVIPLHPRTSKMMSNLDEKITRQIETSTYIHLIPPVSYLDVLLLEKNAKLVMTDSGGVQKESFFFETPTVILRSETEWVEIIDNKAGILTGFDEDSIVNAYYSLSDSDVHFPHLFGDGHSSEIICKTINSYLV